MSDSFDLSEALSGLSPEEAGLALIPEGDYTFEVITAEERKASSGNPQLSLKVQFIGGKYEGWVEFVNLTYSTKSAQAIQFFTSQIQALGLGEQEIRNLRTFAAMASYVEGARFTGTVQHREWQGRKQLQIRPTRLISNPNAASTRPSSDGLSVFKGEDSAPTKLEDYSDDAEPTTASVGAASGADEDPWAQN